MLDPVSENETEQKQSGYIALVSTVIISLILLGLTFTVSSAGYFTRFNSLDAEYKRVSLGLAESCVNVALLKIAKQYTAYNPAGEVVTVGTELCTIDSVTYTTTGIAGQSLVTIQTHACYPRDPADPSKCASGAFSNIKTTATASDPNIVRVLPTTITPTVIAPAGVDVSQFVLQIDGNSVQSGVPITVSPGASHSVNIVNSPPGLISSGWAGACSGLAGSGSITPATGTNNSCYINYTIVPTTARITLVANVTPSGPVPILKLKNNATNSLQIVSSGVSVDVPTGSGYTAMAVIPQGYVASNWSGSCNATTGLTGTLHAGQNYTCVINFTVPNTACADMVVMLDRTGSMSATDRTNEGTATKSFLDLYAGLTPHPKVGIGSIGGLYGNTPAGVPTGTGSQVENGLLTSAYGEGDSTASLGAIYPTTFVTPASWMNPGNALMGETPTPLYATDATNGHAQSYNNFGFEATSFPAGSSITGIEAVVSGKVSTSVQNDTSNIVPKAVANFNPPTQWSTQSGSTSSANKVSAVNDGSDTTYITTNVSGSSQTFKVGTSSVPSGATITSIVISARSARAGSGTPALSLRLEKGTMAGSQIDYPVGSIINTTYDTFSTSTLINNPFTSTLWTMDDISTLGFGVLKTNTSGNLRVSQIYVTVNYSYTPEPLGVFKLNLSWDDGVSWSGSKNINLTSMESQYKAGGNEDAWGTHNWTLQELANENLMLRLTNNSATGQVVSVNYLTLKVYYSSPGTGLYGAIDTMMASTSSVGSDLSQEISVGNAELNSVRHTAGLPKVLVMITDGVPSKPSGNLTSDKNSATTTANTAKTSGTQIFTIHFGDSNGTAFLSTLSSGAGYSFDAPTSSAMKEIFNTIGAKVCPAVASATQAIVNVSTQVINSNGGTATASNFTTTINGAVASPASFVGSGTGTSVTVTPNTTFSIATSTLTGYYPALTVCSSPTLSVSLGETMYCTIILYDQPLGPSVPPPPPPPQNIDIGSWLESPN